MEFAVQVTLLLSPWSKAGTFREKLALSMVGSAKTAWVVPSSLKFPALHEQWLNIVEVLMSVCSIVGSRLYVEAPFSTSRNTEDTL